MNVNDLNAEIARQGFTKPKLAQEMGISKKRLYSRLNGTSSFRQDEVQKIVSILKLDEKQIMNIFFAKSVS